MSLPSLVIPPSTSQPASGPSSATQQAQTVPNSATTATATTTTPPSTSTSTSTSTSLSTSTASTYTSITRYGIRNHLVSHLSHLYRRFFALYRTSVFARPSLLELLVRDPIHLFGWFIFRLFNRLRPRLTRTAEKDFKSRIPIRVVCVSDTHSLVPSDIPDGDLFVHAGDLTKHGTYAELREAFDWIEQLPHPHKVVIAGNHDNWLDPRWRHKNLPGSVNSPADSVFSTTSTPVHSTRAEPSQVGASSGAAGVSSATPSAPGLSRRSTAASVTTPTASSTTASATSQSTAIIIPAGAKDITPTASVRTFHPPYPLPMQGVHYLQHKTIELYFPGCGGRRLVVHGCPQSPTNKAPTLAFQYRRGADAWSNSFPSRPIDILVTHTPPQGYLDLANPPVGCPHLTRELWNVRPKLHVFGHVHEGAGVQIVRWDEMQAQWELIVERIEKRRAAGYGSLRTGWLDVGGWIGLLFLLSNGVAGLVWSWVWGGEEETTVMVNAALMQKSKGLRKKITVVEL